MWVTHIGHVTILKLDDMQVTTVYAGFTGARWFVREILSSRVCRYKDRHEHVHN